MSLSFILSCLFVLSGSRSSWSVSVVSDGRRGSISLDDPLEVVSVLPTVAASLLSIPIIMIPVVSSSPLFPSVVPEISDLRDDFDNGRGTSSSCAASVDVGFVGDMNGSSTISGSACSSNGAEVDNTVSAMCGPKKSRVS